ncbi:MAG: ATP-dependent DNA ligase [Desulfobacterales bacterium CG23_combo_of_CG06-09_8_20_14_all_51_8]|nr:MAG: ATP-dependent DNA ligase [Desulfobacterales bacterium CG23_combo_of_CG06-09_8_20_14_all_51_8]
MKTRFFSLIFLTGSLFLATQAFAHFGMIIPTDSMVMEDDTRTIDLSLSFSHPFEGIGMDMEKPEAFTVMENGVKKDLMPALTAAKVMDHNAWKTAYSVKRPGVYLFCVTPKPYWEPMEDCFIIHYTKTVVTAFGINDGWDAEAGLKTEIVPMSKPYGQYAGNLFQGIVMLDGKPVPGAEVEVEYYNKDKTATAPTDYMVTQTVKADGNGVFSYAAPRAGWWGFAALNTADYQLEKDGVKKDVELGAIIWVEFLPWNEK